MQECQLCTSTLMPPVVNRRFYWGQSANLWTYSILCDIYLPAVFTWGAGPTYVPPPLHSGRIETTLSSWVPLVSLRLF